MALTFKRGSPKPLLHHKFDAFSVRTQEYLKRHLERFEAEAIWLAGQKIHNLEERAKFYAQAVLEVEQRVLGERKDNTNALRLLANFKYKPVSITEFICSPEFLGKADEIYPVVLEAAEELNSGKYVEAVLTGGIGSGKTTLALYTQCYQLYLLSCMRSPHKLYGLDPSSEILIIFQSITKTLATGIDYRRFRAMIQGSKYFKQNYPFNKDLESRLVFPNRVEVVPVAGTETAAIGQNVIGGMIDELNYMAVVEKSKAAVDKGTYDQAVLAYNSIARRRKSRFLEAGKMPGILCLVSSKKYPGQFTDQKVEEARTDPTIYVYDKRVWDVKPQSFGSKGWFHVFVGDTSRKPRILKKDETVPDTDRVKVITVPEDFRVDFEKDVINALREIAGVSTLARHPFFIEVDKVHEAFDSELVSIFSQSPVDFVQMKLTLIKGAFFKPELPRFAHIDLAISGDSAGLVIGTATEFTNVSGDPKIPAYMPCIRIDGTLEIKPPKNSEILFSKVRKVIFSLRKMGLNVKWVTFDQFQSTDSQQILRQHGIVTGHQSIDDVPCKAYDFTKAAIYEGRLKMPINLHLKKEILGLEKDVKTGKVDHQPGSSKDIADALAGVVYGLTMRREIWGLYGIPIVMAPDDVRNAKNKLEEKKVEIDTDEDNEMEKIRKRSDEHNTVDTVMY